MANKDDLSLPDGKICNDCIHRMRCIGFGFSWASRKSCDFYPVRFQQRLKKEKDNG